MEEISSNTLNMHYSIDDPAAFGLTNYKISLGDFSDDARSNSQDGLREILSDLKSYSSADLCLEDQLSMDVLTDYLYTQISLSDYDLYQEPLSYSGGLQMELPILFAEYEFRTEQDVKEYLQLLALLDEYFDQVMDFEAEKSSNGMFMSDEQCNLVIDSCKAFLEKRTDHYLLTTFENRLEHLNLSKRKVASYTRQNKAILEKQLFPAYEKMILSLRNLLGTGINDGGICHFPDGRNYYEILVQAETGSNDSPDVLFERIDSQRMQDLICCSLLQESDPSFMEKCMDPDWQMPDPSSTLAYLQKKILQDFPTPPDAACTINYVDSALEDYLAPAFYIVSPIDNYDHHTIYINEGYVHSDIYAFTTLAHEGYPGHLYQTLMTYTYDFPNIRTILNYAGFTEGWATYIEMLSYHYSGLETEVADFLSHNQSATLSLYASSDIGIHYYGWTSEDMYRFWEGYGISDHAIIDEITTLIISKPGNYLKYYIGYLEFLELKEYARNTFGSDYSDIQFHQAILDIGPAPFSIVKKYLPEFYAITK